MTFAHTDYYCPHCGKQTVVSGYDNNDFDKLEYCCHLCGFWFMRSLGCWRINYDKFVEFYNKEKKP